MNVIKIESAVPEPVSMALAASLSPFNPAGTLMFPPASAKDDIPVVLIVRTGAPFANELKFASGFAEKGRALYVTFEDQAELSAFAACLAESAS